MSFWQQFKWKVVHCSSSLKNPTSKNCICSTIELLRNLLVLNSRIVWFEQAKGHQNWENKEIWATGWAKEGPWACSTFLGEGILLLFVLCHSRPVYTRYSSPTWDWFRMEPTHDGHQIFINHQIFLFILNSGVAFISFYYYG